MLFSDCGLKDYEQLLGLLKENSKLIRRNIEKIILDKEKRTRGLLEQLYPELDEQFFQGRLPFFFIDERDNRITGMQPGDLGECHMFA